MKKKKDTKTSSRLMWKKKAGLPVHARASKKGGRNRTCTRIPLLQRCTEKKEEKKEKGSKTRDRPTGLSMNQRTREKKGRGGGPYNE